MKYILYLLSTIRNSQDRYAAVADEIITAGNHVSQAYLSIIFHSGLLRVSETVPSYHELLLHGMYKSDTLSFCPLVGITRPFSSGFIHRR